MAKGRVLITIYFDVESGDDTPMDAVIDELENTEISPIIDLASGEDSGMYEIRPPQGITLINPEIVDCKEEVD